MNLLSLPEDLVEAIATRAGLEGEARLSGTCRELWARCRSKRAGVSLAGLAPSLTTGGVYARFGKDVRPLLAAVACTRAGNTRRYATVDVLAALLRAYGGWKGLKKHIDAPAERAAKRAETRKRQRDEQMMHGLVQINDYLASSRTIPHSCFCDWAHDSDARGLTSPIRLKTVVDFFEKRVAKRPAFLYVRHDLERLSEWQRSQAV